MPLNEIETMLKAERENAIGVADLRYTGNVAKPSPIDYYNGVMNDMPSIDGRSSAVSTDVSDTVEGMMPGLMEIFAGSDQVVQFDPHGPEDEQAAEQESDYVNFVFMQKNPGFMVLYQFIKDALLEKMGIVKVYWDTWERQERETYSNLSEQALMGLRMYVQLDQDMELDSVTQSTDDYGQPCYTVELVTKRSYACAKVDPVPTEEFGISKRARTMAECTYCYHEPTSVTVSDLIQQGYDEDQVSRLPDADEGAPEVVRARDTDNTTGAQYTDANKAMRPVRITEHYARIDYQEDCKPGLYRVTTGGYKYEILTKDGKPDIVPVDTFPFAVMSPIIMPHRIIGRSIADLVMDIQKIKTALIRQLLDNAYYSNNQRYEIPMDKAHERTLDDLLVYKPGGAVRTASAGGVIPIPNQPIGDFVFPLVEYLDSTREWRTGVTRQGQGIDANSLQNQSATAVNQMFTAAQARMKLVARILAETGIRDMFSLLHATIRKNDRQSNTVRLRNQWVPVDPRAWKARDDMTINVGLGTGSKAQQMLYQTQIMQVQERIAQGGLPIVSPKNIYNSAAELCKLTGQKSADPFFTDPDSPQGQQLAQQMAQAQQPKQDPKLMQINAQMQADRQKEASQAAADQAQLAGQARLSHLRFLEESELNRQEAAMKGEEHAAKMAGHAIKNLQLVQGLPNAS